MGTEKNNVIDELHRILQINIEWLKFAEAKNGALLVASAGWIFGIISYINQLNCCDILFVIPIVLAFISLTICTISFIPKLKIQNNVVGGVSNIIFFNSIANTNDEGFLKSFHELLKLKSDFDEYELHIANQIVANAKIAKYKYQLFKYAIYFFIASVSTTLVYWIFAKIMEGI